MKNFGSYWQNEVFQIERVGKNGRLLRDERGQGTPGLSRVSATPTQPRRPAA